MCNFFQKNKVKIFYFNIFRFKLIDSQLIEFQQVAMKRPELLKSEDIFNRVMVKDNIAILTLLELIDNGSHIVVANAHLHWDPAFADVKLIQSALLLEEMEKSILNWNCVYNLIGNPTADLPTVIKSVCALICGDFNSLSDSGVYEFLNSGYVPSDHPDIKPYNYHPLSENGLTHKFDLGNSYAVVTDMDFTNFTPSFKGVISYIWHNTSTMTVTGLLSHVDKEYVSKCVGFPNAHHASDHIPLVVSFKRKGNGVGVNGVSSSSNGKKGNFK
jgi:CCR4-NOT transcription complex subunit 6